MTESHKPFDYSRLSAAERISLAQELWASVSEQEIAELCPLTPEQVAEIERRCTAVDSGQVQCIPWDEALRQLRERR